MRIPSNGPVGRAPERFETRLFDLYNDLDQTRPLDDPTVERELIEKMMALMVQNDSPAEQYERLGLERPGGT